MRVLKQKGRGVKYQTVISKEPSSFIGFIFLDDADLGEGELSSSCAQIEEVFKYTQEWIDTWEG